MVGESIGRPLGGLPSPLDPSGEPGEPLALPPWPSVRLSAVEPGGGVELGSPDAAPVELAEPLCPAGEFPPGTPLLPLRLFGALPPLVPLIPATWL
jgi:hypothetical protein